MTTIEIPDDSLLPMADMIQNLLRESAPAGYPLPTLDTIRDVLNALTTLADGPQYAAEALPSRSASGDPDYVVRDRRTGEIQSNYHGYFAGQDARSFAAFLNGQEV